MSVASSLQWRGRLVLGSVQTYGTIYDFVAGQIERVGTHTANAAERLGLCAGCDPRSVLRSQRRVWNQLPSIGGRLSMLDMSASGGDAFISMPKNHTTDIGLTALRNVDNGMFVPEVCVHASAMLKFWIDAPRNVDNFPKKSL